MVSLNTHIAYLIMHHDCVIVPQWGAFISSCDSAYYNAEDECWEAPVRSVAFNPELNHNDGLLANSIVRSTGCSYSEALSEIAGNVAVWREMLQIHGSFTLSAVGTFTSAADATPDFVPASVNESASNAFNCGMPRLSIEPLVAEAAEADNVLPVVSRRHMAAMLLRRAAGIAASVAIVASVVVALLNLTSNVSSPLYMASLWDAPAQAPDAELASEPEMRQLHIADDAELRIAMVSDMVGAAVVDTTSRRESAPRSAAEQTDNHRYYLIVSSLASQDEANRFIASAPAELRGNMRVLATDRRFRVYVATGSTFVEANAARNTHGYANRYPDAWVYVKKS